MTDARAATRASLHDRNLPMSSLVTPCTVPALSAMSMNPDADPVLTWIRAGRLRAITDRPPTNLQLEWLWVRGVGCAFLWQRAVAASNLCRTVRALVPVLALELYADGRVATLSRREIARRSGASLAQISVHLNALEACGFLYRAAGRKGLHTCYYPMMPVALARVLSREGRPTDRPRFAELLRDAQLPPLARPCAPVAGEARPQRAALEQRVDRGEGTAADPGGRRSRETTPRERPSRLSAADRDEVAAFVNKVAHRLNGDHCLAAAERLQSLFRAVNQAERFCNQVLDLLRSGHDEHLAMALLRDNWVTAKGAGALVYAVATQHAQLVGATRPPASPSGPELTTEGRERNVRAVHAAIAPLLDKDINALGRGSAPINFNLQVEERTRTRRADTGAQAPDSSHRALMATEGGSGARDRRGGRGGAPYPWIPALLARLEARNEALARLPIEGVSWKVKEANLLQRAKLQREWTSGRHGGTAAGA